MKKRFIDPFTPDLPIDDPSKFSGRLTPINTVVDSLYQLANGQPRYAIITGDRGIGKSSVLRQTKSITEGNFDLLVRLDIDPGMSTYDFISAWHDCAPDQTPASLASGILSQLETAAAGFFKGFKFELNVAGLKVAAKDPNLSDLTNVVTLFCTEISKFSKKAAVEKKSGIVLFFDELDRVKANSGVATFFKLTAEKLSRDGVKNVAVFAAGITGAVQNLEEEHGSINRTFTDIPLPRLTRAEVDQILRTGFKTVGCTFDELVIDKIFALCAGYPEPVHLLGSQILKSDTDDHLSVDDFFLAEKEVVETIRRNKLSTTLKDAGAGKYQKILHAMSTFAGAAVPLSHISTETGYEQNQLSSNMGTLVKRGVITLATRGIYSFVDPLLKVYISRFGVIQVDGESEEDAESTASPA